MTHLPAPRTLAQINSGIAFVTEMLDGCEARLQALRNEPASDRYVVGYPSTSVYVSAGTYEQFRDVLKARFFDLHSAAHFAPLTHNGRGEAAVVISYERALAVAICAAEDVHTMLCGAYRDLLQERVDCEALDLQAAQAAYEDSYPTAYEERHNGV